MRIDQKSARRMAAHAAGQIAEEIDEHVRSHPLTFSTRDLGEAQRQEIYERVEIALRPVIGELEIEGNQR